MSSVARVRARLSREGPQRVAMLPTEAEVAETLLAVFEGRTPGSAAAKE